MNELVSNDKPDVDIIGGEVAVSSVPVGNGVGSVPVGNGVGSVPVGDGVGSIGGVVSV